jgi:Lrp/AsnC family leucine-responsive transcriptional regulator
MMFMEQSDFLGFEIFLRETEGVEHAFKVTGEGCYQVIFVSESVEELETFLNHLLRFGRYKVSSSIRCVK